MVKADVAGNHRQEGESFELTGVTFSDKGTLDSHTATIYWGEPVKVNPASPGQVTEAPFGPPGSTAGMTGSVTGTHAYVQQGEYFVTVQVDDDDDGIGFTEKQIKVTVLNVAPTVDAGKDIEAEEGDTVEIVATFTDPGLLDRHFAFISRGDSDKPERAELVFKDGKGQVSGPTNSGRWQVRSQRHVFDELEDRAVIR